MVHIATTELEAMRARLLADAEATPNTAAAEKQGCAWWFAAWTDVNRLRSMALLKVARLEAKIAADAKALLKVARLEAKIAADAKELANLRGRLPGIAAVSAVAPP